jgi:hypothetical protein
LKLDGYRPEQAHKPIFQCRQAFPRFRVRCLNALCMIPRNIGVQLGNVSAHAQLLL